MDAEKAAKPGEGGHSWALKRSTLLLVYQSFGVVYGDLCISPVYVYKNTFSGKLRLHEEDAEILGVLSLVFWSLTLIPLCKYIIFVLGADDNGEGGTFALYSLLCRNARIGLLNNFDASHDQVSTCRTESRNDTRTSLIIKKFFEKHRTSRLVLLLFVLMATSMVIGDGVLTPTMSVLSAVSGLRIKFPELHENWTVFISCVVLIALFGLQHYGTHRVGFLFAPILIAWLACIGAIGVYNIIKWNPRVLQALSPYYIYQFVRKTGKDGWSSLGGVVLCITGAEAMFADLGHFSKISLRLGFSVLVYPCLVLAYMGEAAYLSKHREDLTSSFYKALPESVFWPILAIATLATAVGSQAIISATFSIISQCRALGCFPRVKIVHTSSLVHGQIYIPEVNWFLMLSCLAVTVGFRDTAIIGNAYGLAVITVMFATTCLMCLIILTVWNRSILLAALFMAGFGSIELLYLSACIAKVHAGGWLPITIAMAALLVMAAWRYGTEKKLAFEVHNKVGLDSFLSFASRLGLSRVPGVGLVYSNIDSGVPPVLVHFATNFPAFHRVLVFVCVQTLTVPKVPPEERFLVGRIGPPECRIYRCTVRYGYKDSRHDAHSFETQLLATLAEFLGAAASPDNESGGGQETTSAAAAEVGELIREKETGVSYVLGNTCVMAHESSSAVKKVAINCVYGFLRRNSRRPAEALSIPHVSLVEVGMVYRV